jgi:hypothetical protein
VKLSRLLMQGSLTSALFLGAARAQSMPASISGKWRIVKMLPTRNPQCWDEERAKTLIGTTLTYAPKIMFWQGGSEPITEVLTRTLSRRKFQDEYKVDLPELGTAAASVEEIDLQHEDADVTGASTEVPGDTIVLAGPGRIVVSACGVFYSAVRIAAASRRAF